ncbi:MAG TPA: 2'-5' RNA ligase family protein [Segeticoccus sp.]|jgi:hypothetical protein|nr:2'-5' RNA ligase family protein [Segeticoccus sp.]
MALALCLLPDRQGERALRGLWDRLEQAGVPSLHSHTHGRHVPHLSYVVLRRWDDDAVRAAVAELPAGEPVTLSFDGLGFFRRGRAWLVPTPAVDLLHRQRRALAAVIATGAEVHRHYEAGTWCPHCSLAPRVRLQAMPTLAAVVYDVLPLLVHFDRAAWVDTGTGERWPLPRLP